MIQLQSDTLVHYQSDDRIHVLYVLLSAAREVYDII